MGLRFYRRVRLVPGVHVNFSRSGPSLTVGVRGAHVTVGKRGVTRTIGLPGSGIFYTTHEGLHSGAHTHALAPSTAVPPPAAKSQGHAWLWIVLFLGAMTALSLLLLRF